VNAKAVTTAPRRRILVFIDKCFFIVAPLYCVLLMVIPLGSEEPARNYEG
jgi:hypothetical protein